MVSKGNQGGAQIAHPSDASLPQNRGHQLLLLYFDGRSKFDNILLEKLDKTLEILMQIIPILFW